MSTVLEPRSKALPPTAARAVPVAVRTDWSRAEVEALFALPLMDLVFRAAEVHRACFDPNRVQVSSPSALTSRTMVATWAISLSLGARQAAPMQKRVAPLCLARWACATTWSSGISFSALRPVS